MIEVTDIVLKYTKSMSIYETSKYTYNRIVNMKIHLYIDEQQNCYMLYALNDSKNKVKLTQKSFKVCKSVLKSYYADKPICLYE